MKNELWKLTAHELKEAKFDKVIIPLGSNESHGMHLPTGTDTMTAHKMCKLIADKVPGLLVLPP